MSPWADHTDEQVLESFTSGGPDREAAFSELVHRYERRVYGVCYRYFGDHAAAQDAAQDTFLNVMRRAGTFRGDSKFSTWMYRVATNTCNDAARKMARRPSTPVDDIAGRVERMQEHDDTTATAAEGRALADRVQEALNQLDELSRTLIILCAIEGQNYGDVSVALDLPVGTIKSRVHRARAKLAVLLEDVAQESDTPTARPISTPTDRPGLGGTSARGPPRS